MKEQFDEFPFFDDEEYRVPPPVYPPKRSEVTEEQERLNLIKFKREELKGLFNIDLDS